MNETTIPDSLIFNMESTAPFKIGFGQNDIFKGQIKEVRLYNRALKIPPAPLFRILGSKTPRPAGNQGA